MSNKSKIHGMLAEFETDLELLSAAEKCRDRGFKKWDCHTPYPVHGLDAKMGVPYTILPFLVLAMGITGCCAGYGMQYWMNAVDYPFWISGKPLHSSPSMIPVTFEVTILFSAFTAFFGSMALNGLPKFYNPLFRSERFRRATNDRFFIYIEAADPSYDGNIESYLKSLGASHVESVEE